MRFSYIKLNAQKNLMKNQFKGFLISILPYVTIVLLTVLNYYLYIFLKSADFPYISSYVTYVKASLFTLSISLSFALWKISQLYSDGFFYLQNTKVRLKLTLRQCVTAIMVSMLKFFLSVAWSAFYLAPCIVTGVTLYYSIVSGNYTFNVMLTLFVASLILFIVGAGFLYVTLKRYSMCNYVIFTNDETDSIKIIAKSIELIEKNTVKYAVYSLSFIGWIFSCVLIIPVFYVLPYIKMAKYSFYKAIAKPKVTEQKPVIFYLNKKVVGD